MCIRDRRTARTPPLRAMSCAGALQRGAPTPRDDGRWRTPLAGARSLSIRSRQRSGTRDGSPPSPPAGR
eukprot:1436044-Pyramimonas_sp.AAC.1